MTTAPSFFGDALGQSEAHRRYRAADNSRRAWGRRYAAPACASRSERVHSPFLCVPFCRGVEQAACLHRCRQMGGPAAAELPPLDSAVAARYSVGSVLGKGAYGKGGERAAPCAPALATEDISSFQQSQRRRAPRALFLPGARVPTPPVGTIACAHRANWAAQ